ncbi:hypothetical protein IM40_00650 [Candidatus Paracaedimonas acanthamoebae]|nr:hypothetical protein IM40_00650 [Candidatus Paracaedimonas acanthamoebae]
MCPYCLPAKTNKTSLQTRFSTIGMLILIHNRRFIEIGSSGRRYTKADVLQALPLETSMTIEATDFEVRFLRKDLILVIYRALQSGENKSSLRSSLWKQTEEGWRIVFHQGTPL